MIEFKNVSFSYDNTVILKNINFKIKQGDFVAIIGSNGAGKTTISKLANGILTPNSGEIIIDGENIKGKKVSEISKKIGYLFQNPDRQICKNTIKEEIMFSLKNIIKVKEKIEKYYYDSINFLSLEENLCPFNLSRGQKQQVALCCTLATKPDILILDEPTTGLDYNECIFLFKQINHLQKKGKTIIIISHDMELVSQFAQKVICLSNGEILCFDESKKALWDLNMLKKCNIDPPQTIKLASCYTDKHNIFKDVFTFEDMFDAVVKTKQERI